MGVPQRTSTWRPAELGGAVGEILRALPAYQDLVDDGQRSNEVGDLLAFLGDHHVGRHQIAFSLGQGEKQILVVLHGNEPDLHPLFAGEVREAKPLLLLIGTPLREKVLLDGVHQHPQLAPALDGVQVAGESGPDGGAEMCAADR